MINSAKKNTLFKNQMCLIDIMLIIFWNCIYLLPFSYDSSLFLQHLYQTQKFSSTSKCWCNKKWNNFEFWLPLYKLPITFWHTQNKQKHCPTTIIILQQEMSFSVPLSFLITWYQRCCQCGYQRANKDSINHFLINSYISCSSNHQTFRKL